MSDPASASSPARKKRPGHGAIALRMLRTYADLVREELAKRSGVSDRRIGAYERGERDIEEGDLQRLLEAMDYPYEAWAETLEHFRRLDWLRHKHLGEQGQVVDTAHESAQPHVVVDRPGRPDVQSLRREIGRIAKLAGRAREQEVFELSTLFLSVVSPPDGE